VIGLFKQKTPANILFVFVLGILLKLPVFKHAILPVSEKQSAVLYTALLSFLNSFGNNSFVLYAVLTYLLLFTQALQLNKLFNDNRMIQKVTYLPAASYLLLTSLIPAWNYFSAPLLINSFVLYVFMLLYKIYNQGNAKGSIYNMGLAIGLCTYIFTPSIIIFGWLIMVLLIIRTFRINELLICLLGVLTPAYFYLAWLIFSSDKNWSKTFTSLYISAPDYNISTWFIISISFLLSSLFLGGFLVQLNLRKMLIQTRKYWSLLFFYFFFTLFIPFLNNKNSDIENWFLLVIPITAFHASIYLFTSKRWLPAFVFWSFTIYILIYQYVGPGWK